MDYLLKPCNCECPDLEYINEEASFEVNEECQEVTYKIVKKFKCNCCNGKPKMILQDTLKVGKENTFSKMVLALV